jgi:hypothetical protein
MAKRTADLATQTLGLEVKPNAVSAVPAAVEQTFIPFLKVSADDERHWRKGEPHSRVHFDGLNDVIARARGPRFPNIKRLDTIVNPRTELLYKVTSPWPAGVPPIAQFPSAQEEERQLRNLGERFVGLPSVEPAVDFYHALKQLELAGPVAPASAKQVIAYLVVHHTRHYDPRPVWIIQTRGIQMAAEGYAAMAPIHPDARNHMRHIVDATTGTWLYSDTAPQPV